jgi:hypothetical protein
MSPAPRRRTAGLVAALASIVAVSCGSDMIDLLPPVADTSGGSANGAGAAAQAGADVGGGPASGGGSSLPEGAAGNAGALSGGGNAGASGQGGKGGSSGCPGAGCNIGGNVSFGGGFGFPCEPNTNGTCTPCASDDQCPLSQQCSHNVCTCTDDRQCRSGFSCDRLVGRCAPSCQNTFECRDGRICDPTQGACVTCTPGGDQCPSDNGDPDAHICYFRRCVECVADEDCTQGTRHLCAGYHCIECLSDKDCGDNVHCDRGSGHCQRL